MTTEAQHTGLGGRRVQFEMFFTLPDFSDISLRDYQETMQRPFFSLSKNKRNKPIDYISPDKSVTVHVSANPEYGMATIWDADIMIYLASHLNALRERGENELSPTIRLQPGDLLKRICWGNSGRAYERLVGALDRLQATTIKTNIRANARTRETTFSWIDSYTHLVDERTQRSLGMEITLSKWFFDGVMDKRNVLAISPLYFEITSGLGKWLYRASRKHAGGNGVEGFTIGFETLHQKSGSESSLPSFKNKILELAKANNLPEISLEVLGSETPRPKLKMVMRRYIDGLESDAKSPIKAGKEALPAIVERGQTGGRGAKDVDKLVDAQIVRNMLANAVGGLKAVDAYGQVDENHSAGFKANAAQRPSRRGNAQEVLDPEIYRTIRSECPGWDLDVMMQQFDAFLNANPDELPRNYSKRFLGFMRKHHERNRHSLRS